VDAWVALKVEVGQAGEGPQPLQAAAQGTAVVHIQQMEARDMVEAYDGVKPRWA
jgi:hypothetical protein